MPPAARKGDPTIHGGMIVEGSPDTTIGGMPAARLLDKHVCPLHGPGPVTKTSPTVFINKMGAARMTDACTCMVPASGAGGGTKKKEEPYKFSIGPSHQVNPKVDEWRKEPGKDWEKKSPTVFSPVLTADVSHDFWKHGNTDQKKGAFETNLWSSRGQVKAAAEADLHNLRNAKAQAGANYQAEYTAARLRGQAGDVKTGSLAQGEAEAKFLSAKAGASAGGKFQVKDGKLTAAYADAEAGIGGSVVEGRAAGKTKAFKIPFLNWGVSFGGEVSGSLLTAEAKAGAFAGYRDNKWTMGLSAKLGLALAGLGGKFSVSIEKLEPPAPAPAPPGIPGVAGIDPIAFGFPTVLIGDFPPPYIPGPPKKVGPPGAGVGGPGGRNKEEKLDYAPDQGPPRQRTGDIDQLYMDAAAADVELRRATSEIAAATGGKAVFPPGLKGRERALEKIQTDYGGDATQLLDISRSTLEFSSMKDLQAALAQVKERFEIVRMKDRFAKPVEGGYRDMLLNVKMPNGHVAEMQMHLTQVLAVKGGEGHKIYEEMRGIKASAKKENRDLTPQETRRLMDLNKRSEDLYGAAFAAASKG